MENKTFTYKNNFVLESGQVLENLTIQYSTLGKLNSRKDNVIWVCHALTANSEVHNWWYGLVGEDKFLIPRSTSLYAPISWVPATEQVVR